MRLRPMKKVLFIDRDGTLIEEPEDHQIDSLEKLVYIPGVFNYLKKIVDQTDFVLVMVTNQDGLGTKSFPEDTFWPAHRKMIQALANEGITFQDEHIDRTFEAENKNTRKPGVGMLTSYFSSAYDLKNSYVIGDRLTDMELAKNMGCKGLLLSSNLETDLENCASVSTWKEVYEALCANARRASINRKTNETDITINLNLDGTGQASISTGIGFFDHMLEQIAKHGQLDLEVITKGDLHIDEHHTIEDTALALGQAFLEALGDKKGIERYGFLLPMDDVLAQAAIDFSGRPWIVWDATFKREMVGDMPTEMFYHFWKSFSDTAKCNLNIKVEGENEHHKIEAIFKAVAKAIKMAKKRGHDMDLPSTKGVL